MKNSRSALVSAIAVLAATISMTLPAQGQALQLTWVDRTGKAIETVGPSGPYRGLDLAPDGKRFAVHRHDEKGGDVWLFNSGPGQGTRIVGDGTQENSPPIWSPDGTLIVFGSTRNGKGGLYMKRADGTGPEELLLESETSKVPMAWSPDGQFIVYWVPGLIQWILPLSGDRKPYQLSEGQSSHAQISPDGKWISYQTNETGRAEIYIKAFPKGSDQWRVSKEGGVFARWSGTSSELFFLSKPTQGQIMAVDIRVTGSSVQAGTPHALFDSGYTNLNHQGGGNYHTFAVSADGQRFLIPRPEKPISVNGENFELNARTLTLFDREGKIVGTVGERDLYNLPLFSPDRSRVAVVKNDLEKGTQDIWVLDAVTGKGVAITASKSGEAPRPPMWSPDGTKIAYVVNRGGNEAIYQKASNGEGPEEVLHKLNGSGIALFDWSSDGRYLTYYSRQLGGNILFVLPLDGDRKPVEAFRSEFPLVSPHVSPDGRYIAYRSVESGKDEIWVRRFDPIRGVGDEKWKVSPDGGVGPVLWRSDGKELYYLGPTDRSIMAVDVRTDSNFEFGAPRLLFKAPDTLPANGIGGVASFSGDGQRFLLSIPKPPATPAPPAPKQQISVFDRQGKVLKTMGEPARYSEAALSPDGKHVVVLRNADDANNNELWTFDLATGEGRSIAKGNVFGLLWSPDGSKILYVSNRPAGYNIIGRRAADGSGSEELLFRQTAGYPVGITDISPDGKFLAFDAGGVIMVLPLTGNDAQSRQPIEFSREEFNTGNGRFSRDGRFMAYQSNESGRNEIWVRAFNAASGLPSDGKWRVTTDGANTLVSWRGDNSEIYYSKGDLTDVLVMAADVSSAPAFQPGASRFLFRMANAPIRSKNVSPDGQQFVFITPVPAASESK